jgi:ABC-type Fe3+-hydroxamate transport system substrate-binding protein
LFFLPLPARRKPALRVPVAAVAIAVVIAAVAMGAGACDGSAGRRNPEPGMRDDFGDTLRLAQPARRIVSLSPVTTEILFALGAGNRVVGRTHWDLYPAAARDVPDLGDGMQPNVEAVLGAHPDLVVLYASPSNRPAAAQLRRAGIATLALRDDHISDFRRTVMALARATGDTVAGALLADSVQRSLDVVRERPQPARPPTVFWHVWDSPILTIGRGSYLDELVRIAGARNIFGDLAAPSPQVTLEEIVRRNPDFILVSPASVRGLRASAAWRAVPAVREGHLLVVDTALVGRPGVRLGEAARSLRALILHDTIR